MEPTLTEAPTPVVDNATTAPVAAEAPGSIIDAPSTTETAPTEQPSFWDGAGEDLANHQGFEGLKGKINNRDALAISYLNLQSKIGQRDDGSIKPITEDSTPEEVAALHEPPPDIASPTKSM